MQLVFQFTQVDEHQRVTFASLPFMGPADNWYQYYQMSRFSTRWATLLEDFCASFEELGQEDTVEEFGKLQRTGSINDFGKIKELRALMLGMNRQLPEDYFVSSFLSGLKMKFQ